jgi:anaerobic selenocysteine-containing dehydrogenase
MMERRNFLKFSALAGAATALDACGKPERQLVRFIPEEHLVPGVAVWKPGVCTQCGAGCGTMVKVMAGDAQVVRHGDLGLMSMGLAKKLEGNPHFPVNQGKLCPRGQASIQITYHPDRVRAPMKRSGARGSGELVEITWDEALQELVSELRGLHERDRGSQLVFLTRPLSGVLGTLVANFLEAFKAPQAVEFEFLDERVLRQANAMSFGHAQLPTLDLARANYAISFGADFLGTWNSPVSQAVGYGVFRQGRAGERGKLVQVEPRLSQTGANADEWVAAKPGTEGILALGLAHVLIQERLASAETAGHAGSLLEGWSQGLPQYAPDAVERETGIDAARITRIARELAGHQPALIFAGSGAVAHTNGLFTALAVNALAALLGDIGKPGGITFTPSLPGVGRSAVESGSREPSASTVSELAGRILAGYPPSVLLLNGANPVFASPSAWRVREALERVPFIASFGSFVDETSVLADLILPDHTALETWVESLPESGAAVAVAGVAPPAMHPLFDTRSLPDVLLDVAHRLGGEIDKALPSNSYEEMLQASFGPLQHRSGSVTASNPKDFWQKVQAQGGWWGKDEHRVPAISTVPAQAKPAPLTQPQFAGAENDFPLHFQPYASQLWLDGSLAHLPWLQETPDPVTTSMWGSWVEVHPTTASRFDLKQGDVAEIESTQGTIQAPVILMPGIAPDVIAMPIGQGHSHFTRYASGRGSNPIAILAPQTESETGALAWSATRVRIRRVGRGRLILFGGGTSDFPESFQGRRGGHET